MYSNRNRRTRGPGRAPLQPAAVLAGILSLLLSACGGGSSSGSSLPTETPEPVVQGLLIAAGSAESFTDGLKLAFRRTTVDPPDAAPLAESLLTAIAQPGAVLQPTPQPVADIAAGASTYSGTYTQEADVGEFDVVKYDGERLFIAPTRQCCLLAAPTLLAPATEPGLQAASGVQAVRVLTTDASTASAQESARIELDDGISVQGMYLLNETLATLTSPTFSPGFGIGWLTFEAYVEQQFGLQLYDVAGRPELTFSASFDGSLISSRRIDDTVFLFTRFTPTIADLNAQPTNQDERDRNAELIAATPDADLLPRVRINGTEQPLIDPADCLVTNNSEEAAGRNQTAAADALAAVAGPPVLTIITAVDLNAPEQLRSVCYNEQAYGLYASSTSVYLTQLLFGTEPLSEHTRIHKFDLATLEYRGSAEIGGLLWSGGQLDFRASEHNGVLRVLTTRATGDPDDWLDHELYTLREAVDKPQLEVLATLPNANAPEEIGKPNEALYGVRFLGNRAYAVTFEQIDPLYVFDLADPAEPALVGELEVTGFSDFLHPIGDTLLLGLGRADNQALKLELFDVADMSAPRSLAVEILGGAWSFSEALYDRHAFTYLSSVTRGDVTVDRLAIPADLYDAGLGWRESGLYLFELGNLETPDVATLYSAGAIVIDSPDAERRFPVSSRYRSVLHDDAVFVVRNQDVYSAFWNDPTQVSGPQ